MNSSLLHYSGLWLLLPPHAGVAPPTTTTRTSAPRRQLVTVGDIFTWMMCSHQFVALAVVFFHPEKLGQFMAYTNTILWAYLEFEGDGWRTYDRTFRLQVSGCPTEDWASLNLSLFTGQSRRRYVAARDHTSGVCPWGGGGVDVAQPISELPRLPLARGRPPFAFPGMLAHAASTTCAPPALPPTGPGLPPGTAPRDCPQGPLHHCPPGPPPPADWPRRPRFPDPPPP